MSTQTNCAAAWHHASFENGLYDGEKQRDCEAVSNRLSSFQLCEDVISNHAKMLQSPGA